MTSKIIHKNYFNTKDACFDGQMSTARKRLSSKYKDKYRMKSMTTYKYIVQWAKQQSPNYSNKTYIQVFCKLRISTVTSCYNILCMHCTLHKAQRSHIIQYLRCLIQGGQKKLSCSIVNIFTALESKCMKFGIHLQCYIMNAAS